MADQAVEKEEKKEVPALDPAQASVGDVELPQGDVVVDDEGRVVPPASAKDQDGDDFEDERIVDSQGDGRTDAEREAIRQRRREEKARKKERFHEMRRELAARDTQLAQMQEQIEILQRRSAGGELAQIDQALKSTEVDYNFYKNQIAEAVAKADGVVAAEATEKMHQAAMRYRQLTDIKKNYQRPATKRQPMDPRVLNHAQSWMEDHDWYDPASKDEDAEIVRMLDNRMAQENWDPRTPEYWEELTRRTKKYLPHRYQGRPASKEDGGTDDGPRRSAPKSVVAGSGQGSPANGAKTFTLSAQRVQAMKDAGVWDDPKRRQAMINRYKEHDRNAQRN